MPHPVEVDVMVGQHGERAHFRFELMANVDPQDFIRAVYDAVEAALGVSPVAAGEPTEPDPAAIPTGPGSVVSGEGPAARSRAAGPKPSAQERARLRAAEAV